MSEIARSRRRRRVFVFILFVFLSGVANVWADEFSYLDFGNSSDLVQIWKVVCLNVAIVSIYSVLILIMCSADRNAGLTPDYEKWADSIYFLGFIITLMALIIALTKIDGTGGPEALISTVHQNGAALSSTVVALIIRTIWNLSLSQQTDDLFLSDRMKNSIEAAAIALAQSFNDMSKSVLSADTSLTVSVEGVLTSFRKIGAKLDKVDLSNSRLGREVGKALGVALHEASEQSVLLKGKLEDLGNSTSLTESDFRNLDEVLRATEKSLDALYHKIERAGKSDVGFLRGILKKIFL